MKGKNIVVCCILMCFSAMPVAGAQMAVVPAYAYVSKDRSTIEAYKDFLEDKNRLAARDLVRAERIFQSPKDVRVEIVQINQKIAQVKTSRLNRNAKPITLYFWTLFDQLILLPLQDQPKKESSRTGF